MKKPLAILLLLFSFGSAQETIAVIEFEGLSISQNEAKSLTNRFALTLCVKFFYIFLNIIT
ncbi:uncharacterized protein METZ01_LOCUS143742 [marine metagenome]|uniref:Uncharacterized protein n=1 Tax=marine metagenome TaxID=408172 RepID=A0A381ZNI8_9ZZZZ